MPNVGTAHHDGGVCALHGQFERDISRRLETLDEKLDRLLTRSEQWLVQGATCTAEITALRSAFDDWKAGRKDIWKAVDELYKGQDGMKRLLYAGMGLCAALSFLIPVAVAVARLVV